MATQKSLKIPKTFQCVICNLVTSSSKDFNRHLSTRKHTNRYLATIGNQTAPEKIPNEIYQCGKCNKQYCDKSGLWRHNKKCQVNVINTTEQSNNVVFDKELVMLLIKENSELKTMMLEEHKSTQQMMINTQNQLMEVLKIGTCNITNNTINKTFNLQLFLNETCKDAMNIMEFVENIEIQLTDFLKVGEKGYVEGISQIITTSLKALDITKRPIHCTDKKRDVLYIKDDDKWEKDENKMKIRKAIKKISNKNLGLLSQYKNCLHNEMEDSEQYDTLLIETLGGTGENEEEKQDNIIKNISKHVGIEKEMLS